MDRFQQLLYDLSEILEIPLYADQMQRCRLSINELIEVQMEYNSASEKVLMASFCCEIPPGKFRENVLKEALKANSLFPRIGSYGYSPMKNKLALFEYISLEGMHRDKFADLLAQFCDRVERTKRAVETNNLPLLLEVQSQFDRTAFEL